MKVICLLICSAMPLLANPLGPDQAALEFLQAVKKGKVNLATDKGTAIMPHASPEKMNSIERRLKRMADEIGEEPLRIGQIKADGDLAAVMIWKDHGYDPSHMQVFPVAMIKRGDQWLPAPVPASFENCGVSYRPESRKRAEALEAWMLQQRTLDLANLRSLCIERMRERIAKQIDRKTLAAMTERQLLERFSNACRNRQTDELLGLLGGFSDPLPDYWPELVMSLQKASEPGTSSPWQLLMSDEVIRVQIDRSNPDDQALENGPAPAAEDSKDQLVTLACLDVENAPLGKDGLPQIQLVHLNLKQSDDGLWQIRPPSFLWESPSEHLGIADALLDKEELDGFAAAVRKAHPMRAAPSAADAEKQLMAALGGESFPKVLELLHIPEDPQSGRSSILHAAQLWLRLHGVDATTAASSQSIIALDRKTEEQHALISCQLFSSRKPDRFTNTALHLIPADNGWAWHADPTQELNEAYDAWAAQRLKDWQQDWRSLMLGEVPVLEAIPATGAPPEEECRTLMAAWFKALDQGDINQALKCCTMLQQQDSPGILLRNLGYEISASLRLKEAGRINHHLSDRGWAAIGTTQTGTDAAAYPLYPIVNTPKGPRILLEIDLIAGGERGRQYLNQTSFNRLRNIDPDSATSLQKLFTEHQTRQNAKKAEPKPP